MMADSLSSRRAKYAMPKRVGTYPGYLTIPGCSLNITFENSHEIFRLAPVGDIKGAFGAAVKRDWSMEPTGGFEPPTC